MRIRRDYGFYALAIAFMALGVFYATDDTKGGSAVWIALGAAMLALGAAGRASKKDGDDAR